MLRTLIAAIIIAGTSACGSSDTRKVAFDNVYGASDLKVHVKVDKGPTRIYEAKCSPKDCTFEVPMKTGWHEVSIAVEHRGEVGQPTVARLQAK